MVDRLDIIGEPISRSYIITQIIPKEGVTPSGVMSRERLSGIFSNAKEFYNAYCKDRGCQNE